MIDLDDVTWLGPAHGFTEFWPSKTELQSLADSARQDPSDRSIYPEWLPDAQYGAFMQALQNAQDEVKRLRGLNKELRRQMKTINKQADLFSRLDSFTMENGSDAAALYKALFADDAIHLLEAISLIRSLKEKAGEQTSMD